MGIQGLRYRTGEQVSVAESHTQSSVYKQQYRQQGRWGSHRHDGSRFRARWIVSRSEVLGGSKQTVGRGQAV